MKKLGKILLRILEILVLTAVFLCGVLEFYPMMHDNARFAKVEGTADWMADIPDHKRLSAVTIPGAHDAGANETQLRFMAKCQDKSIGELLEDGFRYLDIRLGIEEVKGEKELTFYHGFLHCLKGIFPWSPHLTFEDVAKACGDFLAAHPTETILFVVKQEHGDDPVREFETLLQEKIASSETKDRWLLTDQIPTLQEARGKIVLFRRFRDDAGYGRQAGIYIDWTDQGNVPADGNFPVYETEEKDGFTLIIQDRYKYGISKTGYSDSPKWEAFMKTIVSGLQRKSNEVLINFLSTHGKSTFGHPYNFAQDLNKKLLQGGYPFDVEAPTGWTVVDFGDAFIAKVIIDGNP